MEQLNLNKSNPEIEFKFNSEDSYLMIHSVSVTSQKNFKNKWTNFISQVKLTAELKYVVFDDQKGRFIDDKSVYIFQNSAHSPNREEPTLFNEKMRSFIENYK